MRASGQHANDARRPVEAHGLALEVAARCTHRVTIPLGGPTESLNVAMAATVALYEAARRMPADG